MPSMVPTVNKYQLSQMDPRDAWIVLYAQAIELAIVVGWTSTVASIVNV